MVAARPMRWKLLSDWLKNSPPMLPEANSLAGSEGIYAVITILIGIPVIVAGSVGLLVFEEEKKREPFVPYSYMRIRHRRFPWGDGQRSLFHNPKYNALPDGYETEEED